MFINWGLVHSAAPLVRNRSRLSFTLKHWPIQTVHLGWCINFGYVNIGLEFKNSVQIVKLWKIFCCYRTLRGSKFNHKVQCFYFETFYPGKYDLLMRNLISWAIITKTVKKWICIKMSFKTQYNFCWLCASCRTCHTTQLWANRKCWYMRNTLQ